MKVYEAWEKRVWYPGGAPSWRRVPPVMARHPRRVGPVLDRSMRRITGVRGKMIAMGMSV